MMKKSLDQDYYSCSDIARILSVTPATVRSWIAKGLLKSIRVGKLYRISREAVTELIME